MLVCHNGARWLPIALDAQRAASRRPDRWVVVDTGSTDDSLALVTEALAGASVITLELPPQTSYGAAVRAALDALPPEEDAEEWIWLLHDDCAPAPGCLQRLAEIVGEGEEGLVAVGPKLREWPSLQRLLEVGVTITGTGRRLTGLESGEYDQGQYDEYSAVLAVNTAGMLVSRAVLADFGITDELPLFGNDIDFGWRLASAGHTIRIVPTAVVFHAEAAHRRQRDGVLAQHPHRDERIAAMFTVLTNGSARWHPLRLLRLFVGGVLRALGYLLVRAPGEARAEISALAHVYGRVPRMRAARKARRAAATVPDAAVLSLLAPFWMPWRQGLDFVIDVGRAVYEMGRESAARHRTDDGADASWIRRTVRRPATWAVLAAILVAFFAGRGMLTGAPLRGGGLLPAPEGVGHWWHLWADSWHWIGEGTDTPAAPYALPLAVGGSLTLANPGLLIWLMFMMTVPLTIVGALRLGRHLGLNRPVRVWAAASYALLPVLSGAVSGGRLGAVAVAILLPWVLTAAWRLDARSDERRRRALWRTALGIGALGCFLPILFLAGAALAVAVRWLPTRLTRSERWWLALGPLVFLIPWLPVLVRVPQMLLFEAGVTRAGQPRPDVLRLLALGDGGVGAAPWWITIVIPVLAVLALVRPDSRRRVTTLWVAAACLAILAALLRRTVVVVPGDDAHLTPPVDALLIAIGGALVLAIAFAANGAGEQLLERLQGRAAGWLRPSIAVACLVALVVPIGGATWWLVNGTQGPLHRAQSHRLPAYLTDLAAASPKASTLVLSAGANSADPTIHYSVFRGDELRIGDNSVLAASTPDPAFRTAIGRLLGPGSQGVAELLAARGISYVYMRPPVASGIAGAIDAAPGLTSASAPNPRTRAWTITAPSSLTAVTARGHWWQPVLLAIEILGLVAIIVLVVPGRRH